MKHISLTLFSIFLLTGSVLAQTIQGSTTATAGQVYTYTYTNTTFYVDPLWDASTLGTVLTETQNGSTYTATVRWNTVGTGTIRFKNGGSVISSKSVTIAAPPAPSTSFTTTYRCSTTVVKRLSNPSTDYEWYWQTSSTGTSTTLGKLDSVSITSAGPLYLRTRTKNSPFAWSTTSLSVGTISLVSPLAAPSTSTGGDAITGTSASVNLSVGSVSGATGYWWYTASSGGTRVAVTTGTSYSPTLSSTTTYYVATANQSCPSTTRKAVTATIHPLPVISASNNGTVSVGTKVTLSVTNHTYQTYQWVNSSGVPISGATNSSYQTNVPGDYNVKVAFTDLTPVSAASYYHVKKDLEGVNMNYIVTNTFLKAGVKDSDIDTIGITNRSQTVQYFDGLGRPIQTVNTQASPQKHDVVAPITYDGFGREAIKYLPYVPATANGMYHANAISVSGSYTGSEQRAFYQATGDKVADDVQPYSVTVFENSPLNRVLKQGAPGSTWQPDGTNAYNSTDHTLKKAYEFNGANEVLLWTYTYPTMAFPLGKVGAGTSSSKVYYGPGQLYRNRTKDEHGYEILEYIDKDGHIVLRRVQADTSHLINDSNYASTYYIYDDFGNLVCEIQPEGARNIDDYFSADDIGKESFLNRWAFRYRYDERRRSVVKQIPGSAPQYLVYDNRDRVVMSQDGNQRRENTWSFTKYDPLNRPIMNGLYVHNDSVSQEQMTALISNVNFFDTYNGSTSFHGYTNTVFPTANADSSPLKVHSVTYYDNYKFRDDLAGSSFNYVTGDLAGQEANAFGRVVGLVTGTKTSVLGTSDYLWSVNYYDERYRDIQTIAQNHKGGVDRVTSKVDFVGKVLETKATYSKNSVISATIRKRYEYDHAGRLLKTYYQLNSEPEILLSANLYNELGQPVTKGIHAESANVFKQQLDYRYNIRGWITRINNADLNTTDGGPKDYFGMEFGYNNDLGIGTFIPQYNGNISATKWSANLGLALPYLNEPTERAYTYAYDPLGRLREANLNTRAGNWTSSLAHRETMDYDHNGNVLSLYRNNEKGSPMDWLKYNYGDSISRSNQLRSVTDQGIITKGFRDRNTSGDDYGYDGNGNLISDKNKGIDSIQYNPYLDVTEEIVKSSGERVKYFYDADGIKLAEEIYSSGSQTPVKRLDYIGPLVYENDTLKFVVHDEGKVVIPKSPSEDPEYQYQVKDHLGNVRLTFTTKVKTDEFRATMEDTGIADYSNPRVQEMAYFGNLFETEIRNVNQWLNHTSNSIGNAIYLDGSEDKTVGPYTMLKVYPGDTVKMEVFGKFENESSYSTLSLAEIVALLVTPVQAAAIGFEGSGNLTPSSFSTGLASFLGNKGSSSAVPAAYLNYILFDKDFKVVDLGFDRIDASAGFNAAAENTVAFDKMQLVRIIDRVGYIYVYVSNESPSTRVWMDDIKITYGQSPIVQFEDYYPLGLSINSTAFERGNDKYQGMITTDGTGLKDLGFRHYDAALGRFHAVDPLAELQSEQSTYQYASNNPVSQVDVLGLWPDRPDSDKRKKRKEDRMVNGKKVKVHNGFENGKEQRRIERAANQRGREQARASRREQRQHRREEHARNEEQAKSRGEGSQYQTQASSDKDISYRANRPGQQEDADPSKELKTRVSSPPIPGKKLPGVLPNDNQPRFENSVTPPSAFDDRDDGVPSLIDAANRDDKSMSDEQYREYLNRHLSSRDARALYQRMLMSRNYNYQTLRLKENLASKSNTQTSGKSFDPLQDDKIKCPSCPSGWEDLIEFKPPKSIYDKFAEENKTLIAAPNAEAPLWYVQEIEDALGSKINLDKYSVTITELPTVNGDQMTIEELFDYIRINLDDFKSDDLANFFDYPDTEFAESQRWESDDYVGVIKVFRAYLNALVYDDLAVVASNQTESSWTFTTVHSPVTNNHAVSGNRQFGFTINGDGTYTIYTRGADVATGVTDVIAGEAVFEGAENLWNNFLDNIIQFVNSNSGNAGNKQMVSNRYDLEK